MVKKLKVLTKQKVNTKVVIGVVVFAVIIGLSFTISSLLPAVSGEDDSKGVETEPEPLGCCQARDNFVTTQGNCESQPRYEMWCPIIQAEVEEGPDGVISEGDSCSCGCPPGTVECGGYCCVQGQACESQCGYKFCTAKSCPPQYPKRCDAKDRDTCCKADEICGKKTIKPLPFSICAVEIAVCVPPDDGKCEGYCATIEKEDGSGKIDICCDVGPDGEKGTADDVTICKIIDNKIPVCMPKDEKKCKTGEEFCQGGGVQRCCPTGTCRYNPKDGRPFCDIKW